MSTSPFNRRSPAASRFFSASKLVSSWVCASCLTSMPVSANPLAILGGINGVVDAVKRTAGSVATATKSSPKQAAKPRISLPGAHRIMRNMHRDAVIALVGEPEPSTESNRPAGILRDVYKVKHEGSCRVDHVEITYSSSDGIVREISQKCGDVTSDENRSARYSFQLELPQVFDKLALKLPRDQVIGVLGSPDETRATNNRATFMDAFTVEGEHMAVIFDKRDKLAQEFVWGGRSVSFPRVQRSDLFEPVDRP